VQAAAKSGSAMSSAAEAERGVDGLTGCAEFGGKQAKTKANVRKHSAGGAEPCERLFQHG